MNNDVIEQILEFKDKVATELSNKDVINFKLKDVDLDNDTFVIENAIIAPSAVNKILGSMKVKNNFLDYKEVLTPSVWSTIKDNLKDANKDIEFYGKRTTVDGASTITSLLKRKDTDGLIQDMNFDRYFLPLVETLKKSDTEYEARKLRFDTENEAVSISLLDKHNNIDVFNNESDLWKRGVNLQWDSLNYSDAPFFERLICTNGMTAETYGFRTNIQSKKFNYDKIVKEITKLVNKNVDKFDELISERCNHLQLNNVSINEFLIFKQMFIDRNENNKYQYILDKMFDDIDIYKAYGVNLDEKSVRWLATGNSGRNAYNFVNDLTYANTHLISDTEFKKGLDIRISDFFFKPHLDLEDVAQPTNFKVGKAFIDNN